MKIIFICIVILRRLPTKNPMEYVLGLIDFRRIYCNGAYFYGILRLVRNSV